MYLNYELSSVYKTQDYFLRFEYHHKLHFHYCLENIGLDSKASKLPQRSKVLSFFRMVVSASVIPLVLIILLLEGIYRLTVIDVVKIHGR